MPALGIIFLALVLGLSGRFTLQAFRHAHAAGRTMPTREDWPRPHLPALFASRQPAAATTTTGATTGGGKAPGGKAKARKTPQKALPILVAGLTDNWVAARAHRRANPRPPRRRLLDRLVLPGSGRTQTTTPAPAPAGGSTPGPAPAGPAPVPVPTPSPTPATPGDPPMTTPAPSTTSSGSNGSGSYGGGGAGDLGSALTRVISEGESGGLKSKTRTALVLGEGHKMSAEYLSQYARHLQERGEYPAFAWEPVKQAAAMIAAAATKLAEHGTAMQTIANTPMGEAAGKAPAKAELDKA